MSARSRKLSASSRVILAMASVLTVAIAALVLVAFAVTQRTLVSSLDTALAREAAAYSAAMASAPSDQALLEATRQYLRKRTSTGQGLDPILSVVFGSGHTISNSDVRLETAATDSTPAAPPSGSYSTVAVGPARYRMLAVPITSRGAFAGTLRVALSADSPTAVARGVALALGAAGLIALALGLPLSYLATRGALSPLTRMAESAARVSQTADRSEIAYDGPPDELGTLAEALNEMLGRLDESAAAQRAFIADASHELRTPVAVVRGNVDILRAGTLSALDADEALDMIVTETERMARLLDELLALARLEGAPRIRFQPLSVPVLLQEAAARGRRIAACTFVVECTDDVWVSGDPDLLDQALANLVRNAATHAPSDGLAVLSCETDGTTVRIHVTDSGPGIPEIELPRVFDRFYRTSDVARDDTTGGAGLGLAIVKRIVEMHQGAVSATNAEPRGARLTISLPRIEAPDDVPVTTARLT